jgi:flagellar motility protein MotE (MotC chaperone)
MALDNIEKLLEKYFEASTTVAEEQQLREYFAQESVPAHLEPYKPMFNYFSNAKEERFTKQVPLKTRSNLYKWISVAAVAVLTFGIYLGNEYQERKKAEYAYQETKKAFELLAENFGRGTEKVAYLKEFEEAKQKIYNNN